MDDLDIGDDAGATGLAFAFGRDGRPYLIAVIAERRSLIGLLLREPSSSAYSFLIEGYFLASRLSCRSNGGIARTL